MAQLVVEAEAGVGRLTIQQAAAAVGVSERTVRRWVKEGRLAVEKVPKPARVADGMRDRLWASWWRLRRGSGQGGGGEGR